MNPYDWKRQHPQVEVPRPSVDATAEELRQGTSGVLLAGRGMGKSVFLRQVARRLETFDDVRVAFFAESPARLTVDACLEALARELGVDVTGALHASDVLDAYFRRDDFPGRLVLLYDELDRYARSPEGRPAEPPGRSFFNSLESARRDTPELGILAAGSIGVFAFRDVLGSSFLARADKVRISPFGPGEVEALAQPFAERGTPLSEEVLAALALMTGGNPALLTYGLGTLWQADGATERDVTGVFVRFQERHSEFLRDFQSSFADPGLSDAPQKVWDLVRAGDGTISHAALKTACSLPEGILRLDFLDVLDLLEAAGLVRIRGSAKADPVSVVPVTSILSLPAAPSPAPTVAERLRSDLATLLGRLHVQSADFFRPGEKGKKLVPESVFAAFLALGLELLGWQVEREAQSVAGRTDLKLRWNGSRKTAVVEVKVWGRPGYREVRRQVESYYSVDVTAAAVVMLTDAELADWPERYRRECLDDEGVGVEADLSLPVHARLTSTSRTPDGLPVAIDHFLLRLPRGR